MKESKNGFTPTVPIKNTFPDLSIKLSLKSKLKIKKLSTENEMYYWDNVN